MKSKLTILAIFTAAVVLVSAISSSVEGDCNAGIKKVHLDTTPGEFVDDETIEIDDTNGLQVKADSIGSTQLASGAIVQVVNTQTGAVQSQTGTIPVDNLGPPQNTEGFEVMSLAITPTSSTNKLKIDVVAFLESSAISTSVAALFKDLDSDATACGYEYSGESAGVYVNFTHYMTAGTTSEITFKVRVGSNGGQTTFNGHNSGTALMSETLASSITITEIKG